MSSPTRGYAHQEADQCPGYAGILDIPNEVMDNIISNLNDGDFANFRTTTRCVHTVTLDAWYKRVLADKEGLPSLIWAAKFNKPSLITFLLAKFPMIDGNMDHRASKQLSPLTTASFYGSEEAVRALCASGADIDYENHEMHRSSALLHTCRTGQYQIVQILLELGANAHALSCNGSTVFHSAVKNFCYETLEVLLDWRKAHPNSMPDIDEYDRKGRTALDMTYFYREEDEEGVLITVDYPFAAAGIASPTAEPGPAPGSDSGIAASAIEPIVWNIGTLDIKNRRLIATYLVHLGSYTTRLSASDRRCIEEILNAPFPISFSFEDSSLSLAKLLIDHGAAFDKSRGIPSLHTAMRTKDLELVHLILYAGGDINKIDEQGVAAIHILTMQPYVPEYTFTALLYIETMGADMFMRNGAGQMPMDLALATSWPLQIIDTFLDPSQRTG